MRTFETKVLKEGGSMIRKNFLNIRETTRGNWNDKRRYSFT